ncbi:autophagy protein Apg5-domain-containing protein [Zygosaccharomyces rouxii]|nr:autophagy protein Apg5-domain-containing protein [Zygosaccharomyces rouxii]
MNMDQIRELVWSGAINVQINVKQSLLLNEVSHKESLVNVRIPRDTYLVLYLPAIVSHLRNSLKIDPNGNDGGTYWFEFEDVPLFWNYPLGVLYDSMLALNPPGRVSRDTENSINVWKIELAYGSNPPAGVIPLINGIDQIKSYWMHQWKQSCYILNGSAKQVMSLSMQDSQQFWGSILNRDRTNFGRISSKIIPKRPKFIPIILHQTLPDIKRIQLSATECKDDGSLQTVADLAKIQFPEFFQDNQVLMKAVSNGIEVPLHSNVFELYQRLMSFDGFLHVCICLVSNDEYGEA